MPQLGRADCRLRQSLLAPLPSAMQASSDLVSGARERLGFAGLDRLLGRAVVDRLSWVCQDLRCLPWSSRPFYEVFELKSATGAYGCSTTFMHPSFFFWNMSYAWGACSSGTRWV